MAEHVRHRRLDRFAHHVFPLARFVVRLGPRELQDVGEEPLGEAVAAHHPLGQLQPVVGEADAALGGDQALGLEPSHHLADRRTRDLETVGDPRLDDADVVLGQLEDGLAVLLERRMMLFGLVHGVSLMPRRWHRTRSMSLRPSSSPKPCDRIHKSCGRMSSWSASTESS